MKLYTEEQVKTILDLAKLKVNNDERYSKDELLDSLTPIELPSDEEIKERSLEGDDITGAESYELGAKWLKEQIFNQNKEEKCYAFISQIDGKNRKCLKCGKDMFEHYNQNK